jgi:tetratricopeptide (TPR) repeat protein
MSEERTHNLGGPNRPPAGGEPIGLVISQTERRLLEKLQDPSQDHKQALKELASFYADTRRYDRSLDCLRRLLRLEEDLELKAGYALAMGALAEKKRDFPAAVRFYREALVMEPQRNDVWFFVNNNLGYSLNELGQFAEGEKFCRAAIEINGRRSNGHKNLGIALAGQGRYPEAAKSFVTATKVAPGDERSLKHLSALLREHPQLAVEFEPDLTRCEQAVRFAAWAIQRARSGKVVSILLGCNNEMFDDLFSEMFSCMMGRAVQTFPTTHWKDFTDLACAGNYDLAFCIPNNLQGREALSSDGLPWEAAVRAIRRIRGNSSAKLILSGVYGDVTEHGQACLDAGAEAVIELPFSYEVLAETTRRVLTPC